MNNLRLAREKMVREQVIARGIKDKKVISAMLRVPRHEFVDEALVSQAYGDSSLPIGFGQTISKPYIVAKMTEALEVEPGMKVLEIGTGSGYQAAVLAELGAEVFSVERVKPLYVKALDKLNKLRYFNIKLKLSDGTLGWEEYAPYDRILVTAGGPEVPYILLKQLKDPGILVIPVGSIKRRQRLVKITRREGRFFKKDLGPAQFVSLVGKFGWQVETSKQGN